MTTSAKLVILRHGQTPYNEQRLLTGLHDVDLNAKGEMQGDQAGRAIGDIPFDKVYSSHLKRAFNTAARALKTSGAQAHLQNADGSWQIEQRPEIAEVDCGDFSGQSKDSDAVKDFTWAYDVAMPNGESQQMAYERVKKFYEADVLPRLEHGENVLIVAHSGILRVFDMVLGILPVPGAGEQSQKRSIPNAAPTLYDFEDGVMTGFKPLFDAANENDLPSAKKKHGGPNL